jgi:hypothetical protein
MNVAASSDRLNDPQYLRAEAARLQKILKIFAEPETKKAIAEHSFNLAQRAEAIDRLAEDHPVVINRHRSISAPEMSGSERRIIEPLLDEAQDTLSGKHTLRQLACWYRDFAERAGSPVIWEARLRMADSLDEQAERVESRSGSAAAGSWERQLPFTDERQDPA